MEKRLFVKYILFIFITIFLVTSLTVVYASSSTKKTSVNRKRAKRIKRSQKNYIQGQVLVKFKKGTSIRQKNSIKREAGLKKTLRILGVKNKSKLYLLALKPGIKVAEAIKELKNDPNVVTAEPNYLRKLNYMPNDPEFLNSNQWALNNSNDADIDAPEAWDISGSNPVKVAVIDSGIDQNHPDLTGKITSGYNWAGISQFSYNLGWNFGDSYNTKGYAQSVRGTGQKLTHIGFILEKKGRPLNNVTISVRKSLSGSNLASFTVYPKEVGPNPVEIYKKLSKAVTLSTGTVYYLVAWTKNKNKTNYYYIYDNSSESSYDYFPDPYYDGKEYSWDGSWKSFRNDDLYFRTNPNPNPRDDDGHGTHVSGIIAANTNNGRGVAGVSPGSLILPLKISDSSGMLTSANIISAINYAVDKGARVINMSFVGPEYSKLEQQAVNDAFNAGVVLFAAAGNEGNSTIQYPAGYNNVIGVGATDNNDQIADFSTYNSSVDISAPGADILSTLPTYKVAINYEGYLLDYDYISGTSMASPVAAGLGALVISRNPTYTPAQVEQVIKDNAEDKGAPGRDDYYGYGRINALNTLTNVSLPPPDVMPPNFSSLSSSSHYLSNRYYRDNNPLFSWNASDSSIVAGYSYIFNKSSSFVPDIVSEGLMISKKYYSVANGRWYFHLRTVDNNGNWSSTKRFVVNIDRYKPKTYALRKARAKRRRYAKLYWRVADPFTGNKAKVTIIIKKGRSTKKRIKLGLTKINRTRYYRFKASLPKGKYYYYIYAKDQAGNKQHNVARNVLVVK